MTQYEISAQAGLKVAQAMTNTLAPMIKGKLDEKQDIATMPTKVSDFANDSGFQNAQQVEDKIDAKVSSAYKAGGSATMATLPALTAAKLGVVVNMSEDFTTTADFLEGAGKTYPAGTNVVVAEASPNIYKYDVLAGFVDLSGYVQDTRKVGNVPLSADIPVSLTGDSVITVTNTGTASTIGYSVTHDDSGVTAGSKGDATNQTPGFGGTFKALSATVDAKGHVTALGDHTVKVPNATATTQADGLMSKTDKAKLDAIGVTASSPLEVTKTGETYNVTLKDSGVTAGSKGDATNQTPGFGGTFKALSATVDAKGRVTSLAEHNVTVPNATATQSAAGLMSASDKAKLDTLIDNTLTATGKAADAKSTGDALDALRSYLASMEVYRRASGNPATFDDGADADFKEITVTITPTQSGSGEPYPPGGGRNLLIQTLSTATEIATSDRSGTVTFTPLGDGRWKAARTANSSGYAQLVFAAKTPIENTPLQIGGNYIMNGLPSNASGGSRITFLGYASDTSTITGSVSLTEGGGETYFTIPSGTAFVSAYFSYSASQSGEITFSPMIHRASDTDPTFVPYSNIRPISGVSSVTVTRTGENLCPSISAQTINGVTWATTNGVTVASRSSASNNHSQPHIYPKTPIGQTPFVVGETYRLTGCPSGGADGANGWFLRVVGWKADGTSVANMHTDIGNGALFAVQPTWAFISVFAHYGINVTDSLTWRPCIYPSADSGAFEPYQGQTVTVALTDGPNPLTVYGGTLDVTTGSLTATWANIASYNGEALPGRWISDRDVYASGATPTTGAQVVYELATPVPYHLTPAQLATLAGYNAVSSDAGNVAVTYKADTAITFGGD